MVTTVSRASKWLAEYTSRLIRLNKLIAEGADDSSEADGIRDEMDLPWRRMSESELTLLRGIATDLDSLNESPIANTSKDDAVIRPILTALREDEYAKALELIRTNQQQLPSAIASFWRGICCAGLGLYAAAGQFFGSAATLYPVEPLFWTLWMDALLSDEQASEALRVAEEALQQNPAPEVLLKSAAVTFLNAELAAERTHAEELHRKAFDLNTRALESVEADPRKVDELRDARVTAHLHRAMSYARLGNLEAAQRACDDALTINPNSLDAMLVRGFIDEQSRDRGGEARASVTRRLIEPAESTLGTLRTPITSPLVESLLQN